MRAIYVRTSTRDQHGEAQLAECRRAAEARGWAFPREYIDRGVSSRRAKRPALEELRKLVAVGEVREIMMTEMTRLARSVVELDQLVGEVDRAGCKLIFLRASIDTGTATGRMIFHVLSALAEFERDLTRERVVEGIAAARARGVQFGRPRRPISVEVIRRAIAAFEAPRTNAPVSWRSVAEWLDVPVTSLRRAVEAYQNATAEGGA